MSSKLYVGNLPFSATEAEVHECFSQAGEVTEVALINDRMTGRPRGFAFVTMASPEAAQSAIEKLNGVDFGGRELKINEARPREERPDGGDRGPRPGGGFRRSYDGPPRGEGGFRGGPRGGGGARRERLRRPAQHDPKSGSMSEPESGLLLRAGLAGWAYRPL